MQISQVLLLLISGAHHGLARWCGVTVSELWSAILFFTGSSMLLWLVKSIVIQWVCADIGHLTVISTMKVRTFADVVHVFATLCALGVMTHQAFSPEDDEHGAGVSLIFTAAFLSLFVVSACGSQSHRLKPCLWPCSTAADQICCALSGPCSTGWGSVTEAYEQSTKKAETVRAGAVVVQPSAHTSANGHTASRCLPSRPILGGAITPSPTSDGLARTPSSSSPPSSTDPASAPCLSINSSARLNLMST